MTIPAHVSVAVPDVKDVPVSTLSAGKNHAAVTDRSDRRAHRRRVVGALMPPPDAEHRMASPAENAGNPAERDRRTEKGSPQRFSGRIEVLTIRARALEQDRLDLVPGEREPGTEDLVHENGAVRLLKSLDENMEFVPVLEVPAHVDAILEDVGERIGKLSALGARQTGCQ